jgi:hypothetical protein
VDDEQCWVGGLIGGHHVQAPAGNRRSYLRRALPVTGMLPLGKELASFG